jgi:non-ribosomal peptide synthetase component F
MSKYSGEKDISIGSPLAGRNHKDLEDQVGLFINIVVLRDWIGSDETFQEILEKVKQTTVEAYEHQNYPALNLIQDLNLELDPSRNMAFDVLVTFHNQEVVFDPDEELMAHVQNLKIDPYPIASSTSRFDLAFDIKQYDKNLEIAIEYNTDLFTEEYVVGFGENLQQLSAKIIKNKDCRVKELIG